MHSKYFVYILVNVLHAKYENRWKKPSIYCAQIEMRSCSYKYKKDELPRAVQNILQITVNDPDLQ